MNDELTLSIAVLPGDGIGPDVTDAAQSVLDAAVALVGGVVLDYVPLQAGAAHYQKTGVSIPDDALNAAKKCEAILLGAMGLPHVRYPDGREIAPQIELREKLDLFAGVRPIRSIPGLPSTLSDPRANSLDFVLVRESTEGLFKSRLDCQTDGETIARDTLEITRAASERVFRFAFNLARSRKAAGQPGRVTCVDKANVLGSFAFFRGIFDEIAATYSDIEAGHGYVDAVGLWMLKRPWSFDVLVTENMFGDILSDIGAALMGGMGMAPSADIGHENAVFQPCHGSAPDIVGQGVANPTATILSAAMMLDWLAQKHRSAACKQAAMLIQSAVDKAFADGSVLPVELGGSAGTEDISAAVRAALHS